jgi:uncharacterized protein (DUF885 family)
MPISALARPADDLVKLEKDYISERSRFFPVWATSVGIHDYDSLLTDYSANSIYQYRISLSQLKAKTLEIDTTKLNYDDYIDYKLLCSDIDRDNFFLIKYPLHVYSPALYVEEALNSIHCLMISNSLTQQQKAFFAIIRMRQFPRFLRDVWETCGLPSKIFFQTAIETAENGTKLIDEVIQKLIETYPDSAGILTQTKGLAITALKDYKSLCEIQVDNARGTFCAGKKNFDYLLKNVQFLDINSDSLKKIGYYWFNKSNAVMDSLGRVIKAEIPETTGHQIVPDTLSVADIMAYYQWEINQTADYLRKNNIVTIPDDIGACIPIQTPPFLSATLRGIAYEPPAPFDKDQTGYFYVRPIPPLDSLARDSFYNLIINRKFKGSVVHEAYPGHHLQFSMANRHPSIIRKIQGDNFLIEGWALYCEQMATEQGLFDDQDLAKRWQGVWGGIRFRAVRIIVDCSLHDSTMSPDSALVFMNYMLGENANYYTAEIRRYCANPTVASSYLVGKILIMDMLDKARNREGKAFSLKKFHDSLLAEGSIPPVFIAKKLAKLNK